MTLHATYVVDNHGKPLAVQLPIKDYDKIIEALEDIEGVKAYDKAKASKSEAIPFKQALKEIEARRKNKSGL